MSLNHFASDFSQTHWWPQSQQHQFMEPLSNTTSSPPPTVWPNSQFYTMNTPTSCSNISALRFDLNNEEDEETDNGQLTEENDQNSIQVLQDALEDEIPKEPLFEKPLTPSDVGKLNRLVIPKQHAEKYFPMNGVSESGEKGLLLSFEDELGKQWRFRYSYWNSSQSYVLTKGWSRFVKEKKLDAGDIVQFERHRFVCERMFIGWRRKRNVGSSQPGVVVVSGGNGGWQTYPAQPHGPALPYPPGSVHAAAQSRTITTASGNCRRLRLFGVNMECQPEAPPDQSGSSNLGSGSGSGSGAGVGPANYNNLHHQQYHPKLHANYGNPNHMEVDYPRDINQSRYQQG